MANTYSQLYIHAVFAVKNRASAIAKSWRSNLYGYISGIVNNKESKLLTIGGTSDHIHIFMGLSVNYSISDIIGTIKRCSTKWINDNHLAQGHFAWQKGYTAFSYSHSHIKNVCEYIDNQEVHHTKQSFRDEYIDMLKKFDIQFDSKYIFKETVL